MGKKSSVWMPTLFLLILLMIPVLKCHAEESGKLVLMVTLTETDILEECNYSSNVIMTIEKGVTVICLGEENGWLKVSYQDSEGYARTENLTEYVDRANMEKEFSDLNTYFLNGFDKIQEMQKERIQNYIWGIVIGLLLIVSILVGVTSAVKKSKEKK